MKNNKSFTDEIFNKAKAEGLVTNEVEPIYDGIYSEELYNQTRIGWLLKEPYDDKIDDRPYGGGWSIPLDCYDKDDCWKSRSWQPIIYTMFGILHDTIYDNMDWIRDNSSMAEVMKNILYLNLSKMPNMTSTNMSKLWESFKIWKDIVYRQIEYYDPEILICAGTFNFIRQDLEDRHLEQLSHFEYNEDLGIYKTDQRYYIATYHPQQTRVKRYQYVDDIINVVKTIRTQTDSCQ